MINDLVYRNIKYLIIGYNIQILQFFTFIFVKRYYLDNHAQLQFNKFCVFWLSFLIECCECIHDNCVGFDWVLCVGVDMFAPRVHNLINQYWLVDLKKLFLLNWNLMIDTYVVDIKIFNAYTFHFCNPFYQKFKSKWMIVLFLSCSTTCNIKSIMFNPCSPRNFLNSIRILI